MGNAVDPKKLIDEGPERMAPVIFARTDQDAEEIHVLLADHDIEAVVGFEKVPQELLGEKETDMAPGVPVLVLQGDLDEARAVIADREDTDGFVDDDERKSDDDDDEEPLESEIDPETESSGFSPEEEQMMKELYEEDESEAEESFEEEVGGSFEADSIEDEEFDNY